MLQIHWIPAIETFQVDNVYIGEAYCCCYGGYKSQSVILMILSDCPTDTYIGHSSFCIVSLMEPRPLFIRIRDGSFFSPDIVCVIKPSQMMGVPLLHCSRSYSPSSQEDLLRKNLNIQMANMSCMMNLMGILGPYQTEWGKRSITTTSWCISCQGTNGIWASGSNMV